jgi:hypothetical protein
MIKYNRNIRSYHRATLENFIFHKVKWCWYKFDSFIKNNEIYFEKNWYLVELKVNKNVFIYNYKDTLEQYKMIEIPRK